MAAIDEPVGIESPDFSLKPGQTYVESVIERYNSHHGKEEIDALRKEKIKEYSDDLIRYIEQYAIPFAIKKYLSGEKMCKRGRITWGPASIFSSELQVHLYVDQSDFLVKAGFRTINVYESVATQVKTVFSKIPGITCNIQTLLKYLEQYLVISIKFPINAIQ